MNTMNSGHPEISIARRLAELERQPGVTLWRPGESASGRWEASGDGWHVEADNPSVLCDDANAKLKPQAKG
jgi:hypothetical protein